MYLKFQIPQHQGKRRKAYLRKVYMEAQLQYNEADVTKQKDEVVQEENAPKD
jgi:hypothetical protein